MLINFNQLKQIYNSQMNLLLASDGLTTRCQLNFGVSKKSLCPNCIYDPNLKKSSNKYKPGGPVSFNAGKICPVCNGIGSYGEVLAEDVYLAVLWDYKTWISPPSNIANPEGFIQTICSKDLLHKIKQCKDMTVVVNENLANPVFTLYEEPNFAGLGDNNYLFCMWKKTGSQNIIGPPKPTPTRSPTQSKLITATPTPTNTKTPTVTPSNTPTITNTPSNTSTNTPTPTTTPTNTPTISITPSITPTSSNTPTITLTSSQTPTQSYTATSTPTQTPTISISPTRTPTASPTPTQTITPSPTEPSSLYAAGLNSANYGACADWNTLDGNLTSVGNNGGPSAYGTYDMGGNVWEWTETISSIYRILRGGAYNGLVDYLASSFRNSNEPTAQPASYGFRIVSLSGNPYSFSTFVEVGDFTNGNDTSPLGYGSVSYGYSIQVYETTNLEYTDFLNKVAYDDTYGLYNTEMGSDLRGGIERTGISGSYSYSAKSGMSDKPVNFISWFDVARFANWLHNGMPSGLQDGLTTESGAYILNGAISGNSVTRTANAKYVIPTENEWYKAAYYKGGSTSAGYWNYATQSDTAPNCISVDSSGVPLPTATPTNTPTSSITPSPTRTSTITPTPTISPTPTNTPTISVTPSQNTPTPTQTVTPTITNTPTSTVTPTETTTNTPTSSITATNTPTNTQTPTQTPTPSNTATNTPTPSFTATNTPTVSITPTNTPTISDTPTQTPTPTVTPSSETPTPTPTITPTNTPTNTVTPTNTTTPTPTQTQTSSQTPTPTNTITPTATPTPTFTPTNTITPTETPTQTPTPTPTQTIPVQIFESFLSVDTLAVNKQEPSIIDSTLYIDVLTTNEQQ